MSKQFAFLNENGAHYPEWSASKLGEVTQVVGGGTPDTTKREYWNGEVNWFSPTEIGDSKYVSTSVRKITDSGLRSSSARLLPVGTVLLTSRASLGRMAILQSESSTNQGFQSLVPDVSKTTSNFIYYLQNKIGVYCDLKASGSTFKEISGKEIRNMPILLPSLAEQQKIAEFFSALDERIALTADKVKLLKEQKQGYLQKVFSRELVFTDDSGDTYAEWEDGTIASLFDGKNSNLVSSTLLEGNESGMLYKVYGAAGLAGYNKSYMHENSYVSVIKDGAGVGRLALREGKTSIVGTMTALLPKENCNVKFGYYLLERNNLASDVSGSTIPHIYFKDYSKKLVKIPSSPEQDKIAEFFSALDEQIELTENKLALLKEQKQGYLQGIFG